MRTSLCLAIALLAVSGRVSAQLSEDERSALEIVRKWEGRGVRVEGDHVVSVQLARGRLPDGGIAPLKHFSRLRSLSLSGTHATDTDVAWLVGL
jgi:hypothetical protein